MNPFEIKKKRQLVLLTIFEMAEGEANRDVVTKDLMKRLNMDDPELSKIARVLNDEGLVTWMSFQRVAVTPAGRREAESIMESRYEDNWKAILKMIYDRGGPRHMHAVNDLDLGATLVMSHRELGEILIDLDERKGFIRRQVGKVWMTPAGLEYIESGGASLRSSSDVNFVMNVHGDNYGPIQQGNSNTQQITINQPISEILPKLAELISAVKAQDFEDKDEVIADLERVQSLAQGNINEGTWKRIQTRLTAAKTTMEITGLAYKSLPYWPIIWEFFHQHFR